MEDIKIGRASIGAAGETVTQATGSAVFVGANPKRTCLIVWTSTPDQVRIQVEGNLRNAAHGILLTALNRPLVMHIEQYGDLVTKSWAYADGTGGIFLEWIEVILVPDKV